jgi:hypothetical protein
MWLAKVGALPAEDRGVIRKQSNPQVRRCISKGSNFHSKARLFISTIVNQKSSIKNQIGEGSPKLTNSNMEV